MRLSLRYRLLVPPALLLVGIAGASAWTAYAAAAGAERRIADQLWAVERTVHQPPTFPLTDAVLRQMKGLSGAEFLLVRANGTRVATLPDPAAPPPPEVPVATPAGEGDDHSLGPAVTVSGRDYRCLRLPLRPPHPNEGGTLYVFYPEALRRSAVRDAARPPLVLGAAGGLVAVALTALTAARLVRRVRDLKHRTRLIADGDFRPMPLPPTDDELRDLCRSVNDMARKLAEFADLVARTERLRLVGQFSGGLAHQLRNAAAGARLGIDLYLAENPLADPEPLRVALRQLDRMELNLRQFLELGKPSADDRRPCDLVKLIGQAVTLLGPQCRHTGTELVWKPPDSPAVTPGDANQLAHLFANLLGNAVEAAGPGGRVEVSCAATPDGWAVEVADTGPGPPADIAAKLFEPFVTGKPEGIGLGLSVAKQAADAHGGILSWERRAGATVFRVELAGGTPT